MRISSEQSDVEPRSFVDHSNSLLLNFISIAGCSASSSSSEMCALLTLYAPGLTHSCTATRASWCLWVTGSVYLMHRHHTHTITQIQHMYHYVTPTVDLINPGQFDHRLLRWTCHLQWPHVLSMASAGCQDVSTRAAAVGTVPQWDRPGGLWLDGRHVQQRAQSHVDQLLLLRTSTCRSHPSDPWFDNDCRNLQSVINAVAPITVCAQQYDLITPLLKEINWPRMTQCI